MLPGMFGLLEFGLPVLNITISTNQSNINLFTLAGSPTSPKIFNFIINSGVLISSTSTATASLVTGSFPSGSIVNLINNGEIKGMGGTGGHGGGDGGSGNEIGTAGTSGGAAISLGVNLTITNASGYIFGGGGGGGGGTSVQSFSSLYFGGGGGGGGASGSTNSPGGTGGLGNGDPNGTPGTNGTSSGAGTGGTVGAGNGGTWGEAGATAEAVAHVNPGAAGGGGGHAIKLNGYSATFLSGNDSTHVKGAIS